MLGYAVNHHQIRFRQSGNGFAQGARGEDAAVSKSACPVDHDDLAITREAKVLQPIVGDDYIDSPRNERPRAGNAIAGHYRGASSAAKQEERLIAYFSPARIFIHEAQRVVRLR